MATVWLITGCSSGFGREIALAALEHGNTVVATARDPSSLGDLVSKGAIPAKLDVTSSDEIMTSTIQGILKEVQHIDILVNNPGYVLQAAVEEASPTDIQAIFSTNLFGMLTVLRAVLPHMRSRRSGVIANNSSMMSALGSPAAGYYCATKAACTTLTESLREEVASLGIEVTALEPGEFKTAILNDSRQAYAESKISDFEPVRQELEESYKALDGKQPGDIKKGAKLIVEALTGTGRCAGKKLPPRLALGSDAVKYLRDVMDANRKHLDDWADLVSTTDCDDVI